MLSGPVSIVSLVSFVKPLCPLWLAFSARTQREFIRFNVGSRSSKLIFFYQFVIGVAALSRLYEFGQYCLDAESHTLFRGNSLVQLPPKAIDTLLMLVENAGAVVGKTEIMNRIWCDTYVQEGSLTRTISILRKALGPEEEDFIATVPKRGYRFVAPVSQPRSPMSQTSATRLMLVVL